MFNFSGKYSGKKASGIRCASTGTMSLLSMLLLVVSCGDKLEATTDLSKFSGLYSAYLSGCKDCHEPNNVVYKEQVKNLDMSSESAAYASLTATANIVRWSSLGCESAKYVTAGSSARSVLYAIIDSETADSFGSGACKPLKHTRADGGEANTPTGEQKQKIKEWIDSGAPRN